jgi:hypothetical protein
MQEMGKRKISKERQRLGRQRYKCKDCDFLPVYPHIEMVWVTFKSSRLKRPYISDEIT